MRSFGVRPKKRIPLKKAEAWAEKIYARLSPLAEFMAVAGSIRRRRKEVGDIEFVVLPRNLEEFMNALGEMGFSGGTRKAFVTPRNGPKIEIYLAHKPEELGAMLFTYTGDYLWNISMRSIAQRRGWKLNQYGLWDAATDEVILQSPYEEDFFGALGVDYHTPEERSLVHRPRGKKPSMGAVGPRDWSPRLPQEIPGHVPRFEEILSKLSWDRNEWREPDYKDDLSWIWYGPGGKRGDYATELEWEGDGWRVSEYARVGTGHSTRGLDILKTTIYVGDEFFAEALWRTKGIGVDKEGIRADDEEWAKFAVSLGVADLQYYGGSEHWVEALP